MLLNLQTKILRVMLRRACSQLVLFLKILTSSLLWWKMFQLESNASAFFLICTYVYLCTLIIIPYVNFIFVLSGLLQMAALVMTVHLEVTGKGSEDLTIQRRTKLGCLSQQKFL